MDHDCSALQGCWGAPRPDMVMTGSLGGAYVCVCVGGGVCMCRHLITPHGARARL